MWALADTKVVMDFGFISEETCSQIDTLLSIRKGREVILVILSPHESWSTPVVPRVDLTYYIFVRMYSKAVVCRLLSPLHPQRSFVKGKEGLTEGRRRAAERKVSNSSKTLKRHSGSVLLCDIFFVCLIVYSPHC